MMLRVRSLRCSSGCCSWLHDRAGRLACGLSDRSLGLRRDPVESVLRLAHSNNLAVFGVRGGHCRGCGSRQAPARLLN